MLPAKKGLPKEEEILECVPERVTQFAAWVKLPEYPEATGIIPIAEVAGKWIRDVRKYVKRGKSYLVKVIGLEPSRKLVRLSLRRVAKYEAKEKHQQLRLERRSMALFLQAAKQAGEVAEEKIERLMQKFGSLGKALQKLQEDPESFEELLGKELTAALLELLERRREKIVTLKVQLRLQNFEPNGVELIKEALQELERKAEGQIKYISAPFYRLEVTTKEPKKTEKKLKTLLEKFCAEKQASYSFVK